MNAYPVRLAAGLALITLCALAEESPKAKMAEPQAKPTIAQKTLPYDVGLNALPVQLPAQVVDGSRSHIDRLNQDLQEAFQREEATARRAIYQKNLTKNTSVDLLAVLLVTQKMVDPRVDAVLGGRDQTILPSEDESHRTAASPILRSSW